jgi:hypothetical protein
MAVDVRNDTHFKLAGRVAGRSYAIEIYELATLLLMRVVAVEEEEAAFRGGLTAGGIEEYSSSRSRCYR